jgi:hypothetical protein
VENVLVYLKVRKLMAYVLYELGLGAASVIFYEKMWWYHHVPLFMVIVYGI